MDPYFLEDAKRGGYISELIRRQIALEKIVRELLTRSSSGGGTWGSIGGTITNQTDLMYWLNAPDGTMKNGKIVVSVAANNLTFALKTLAGNDPSAGEPVQVKIKGVWRSCTAALTKTINAGTNTFNSGGTELAAKQQEYFVYAIWNTTPATDILDLGASRFPGGTLYSDFSSTATNEKHLSHANASNPAAGDDLVCIGRFAATLSAGAGYTWTVPTFTSQNLIQHPIDETSWLTWRPIQSANLGTITEVTTLAIYKLLGGGGGPRCLYELITAGVVGGGGGATLLFHTVPFDALQSAITPVTGAMLFADGSATPYFFGGMYITAGTPDKITFAKYNLGAFHTSGTVNLNGVGWYQI